MEAASARFAARDRWSEMGQATAAPSQLQRLIHQACTPRIEEPNLALNLALNLEIADLINSKKGSAPREAAMAIVSLINRRDPEVALLALGLLDICVKNCGYPFHLQISTKEFLNELVRRFPERPPVRPTRVQLKILEAIEEWRGTICVTSRYKEDLGFVRDMHRLLSYKGYSFPAVRREDAAVLNPGDGLKSAEEMEEEEREAQSAKLQELIRRGAPEDLQEANRLMKVMAGYDTRSKVDYRAKAAEDVARVQQKARLLEDRLAAFAPAQGDRMTDGDVFAELAAALQSAQPKIQKMCEEESDDHEAVARLLEINDSIHRTVERYKLMKRGDVDAANRIARGLGTSSESSGAPAAAAATAGGRAAAAKTELSLIDFDDGDAATNGAATGSSSGTGVAGVENDLLGLSVDDSGSFGQPGGIALGFGANTNVPGPALLSSITPNNSARGPLLTSTPPPPGAPSSSSSFSAFSAFPPTGSSSSTPQPARGPIPSAFAPPPHARGSEDPFAALGSAAAFSTAKSTSPAPAAAPQIASSSSSSSPRPPPQQQQQQSSASAAPSIPGGGGGGGGDEDEWSFSSALPPDATAAASSAAATEHTAVVSNTSLRIDMLANRAAPGAAAIALLFAFSNNTAQPIAELHFQLAVTKGYELRLKPQSGRSLEPRQVRGITQAMEVGRPHAAASSSSSSSNGGSSSSSSKVETIKLRWKVSYRVGGERVARQEMGEIPEFRIA